MQDSTNSETPTGKLELSLDVSLRILFINATGPFGADFAERYHAQIAPLRSALQPIAWGSLATVVAGESLANDEVRNFLISSIKDAKSLGLKVTALVLEQDAPQGYVQWWDSVYQQTGLRYRLFYKRQEAISFLIQSLS